MRVQLALADFLRGFLDRLGNILRQETERGVGGGRVFLDQPQRTNKLAGKAQIADGKILDRPGGLGAVVGRGRDLHLSH